MPILPLDGPSVQALLSVGTGTVVEAKGGVSTQTERKVVTIQPLTGKCYLYFGAEGVTPNAATVSGNGIILFKNGVYSYEASSSQKLYLLSVSGTINVAVAERA